MMALNSPYSVLKGALSPARVWEWRELARTFFAIDWNGTMGEISRMQNGVSLTAENASTSPHVAALRNILPAVAYFMRHVNGQKGLHLIYDYTSVRRQEPGGTPLPWHQDAYPMGTTDPTDGFVLWIPLGTLRRTMPVLEFALADKVHDHVAGDRGFARADIDMDERGAICCPDLGAGDVVMFGLDTLHRTYVPPGARHTRYSCDLRVGTEAYIRRCPDLETLKCG